MTQEHAQQLVNEVLRRAAHRSIAEKARARMFDKQRAVAEDAAKRKTVRTSRRAGKTDEIVGESLETADKFPEAIIPYITITRPMAQRNYWRTLKGINYKEQMGLAFNETSLTATLPNGAMLWAVGADKRDEIDKLRGNKYPKVFIDEAQAFGPHLEELVEEVIEPATIDYDGVIVLAGTPNAACAGLFYEADTGIKPGWSNHYWTVLENPHLPNAKGWLERRRAEKGWAIDHPVYLREWCGQWVRSLDSLVYKYNDVRNLCSRVPVTEFGLHPILGIDLGYEDESAFQVVWFSEDHPKVYFGESTARSGMLVDDIAAEIRRLEAKYGGFVKKVADTGGLGKTLVEEINKRHGLGLVAAEKQRKYEYVELLNADLFSGRALVEQGAGVIDEWKLLQWDEDRKKEDPRFKNHRADAGLYAWREARHYLHEEAEIPPERGSPAYWKAIEDKHEAEAEEAFAAEQGKEWWE